MLNTIEIKWDLLGAKLAALGDDEQSKFFMGFARELASFETHYQREVQMISVGDKLDERAKQTLEKYLPAMWYKDAPAGQ